MEKKEGNPLSESDRIRYDRQLRLPEVGVAGQDRLKRSGVLVIGAGGLGSAALLYLASSGVGRLGIVDPDKVELGNLARQVVHGVASLGQPKVESARRRLLENSPDIAIDTFAEAFLEQNGSHIADPYEILVDATDNLESRRLINRICIAQGKPMVYGSAQRFEGQVGVFDAKQGACYRCAFPELPPPGSLPSPAETGVFGPIPGIIGILEALETMKILLEIGEPLYGKMLILDCIGGQFREIRVRKQPNCPDCSSIDIGLKSYSQ
jgi:adenylyltransferase/sulfurtransferase